MHEIWQLKVQARKNVTSEWKIFWGENMDKGKKSTEIPLQYINFTPITVI